MYILCTDYMVLGIETHQAFLIHSPVDKPFRWVLSLSVVSSGAVVSVCDMVPCSPLDKLSSHFFFLSHGFSVEIFAMKKMKVI